MQSALLNSHFNASVSLFITNKAKIGPPSVTTLVHTDIGNPSPVPFYNIPPSLPDAVSKNTLKNNRSTIESYQVRAAVWKSGLARTFCFIGQFVSEILNVRRSISRRFYFLLSEAVGVYGRAAGCGV